ITKLSNARIYEHCTFSKYRLHLTAAYITCHIKIMNAHIHKHTARCLNIARRGRCWIARSNFNDVRLSNFVIIHELSYFIEIMIKATIEAYLKDDARLLYKL